MWSAKRIKHFNLEKVPRSVESQQVLAPYCGHVSVYHQRKRSVFILERIYQVLCVSADPLHLRVVKQLKAKKIDFICVKRCHLRHDNLFSMVNFKNAEHFIHNTKLEIDLRCCLQYKIQEKPIPFFSAIAGLRCHNLQVHPYFYKNRD